MHRVARLECDHLAPARICELSAQFRGSWPKRLEIVMARELQAFKAPTDVPRIAAVHQVSDAGMRHARGLEDGLAFGLAIGLPYILDMEDRDHHALRVAQGDFGAARFQVLRKASLTSSVIGIGQRMPLLRRIS